MQYIWDDAKRQQNIKKHGIDFEEAFNFNWESAHIIRDARRDYGEDRFVAIGFIGNRLHVMAFTLRINAVRVITLRKANDRERSDYEKAFDQ